MTGPESLKPRDITAGGLRILPPLKADETARIIGPDESRFNPADARPEGFW